MTDDLTQPNGIIGTADGKTLYVADIRARQTWRYAIGEGGRMTLDDEGNRYLTGNGVRVFSPDGEPIEHIEVDAPWTANVAFCGKDRQTLFITASTGLFSVRMRTKAGTPAK